MPFTFQKIDAGGFVIYKSQQEQGDQHLKRFSAGVTPQNQSTLNVYVSGSFRLTAGDYSQDFDAGSTSLDCTLSEYPAGVVFTEEVISPAGVRYCVSRQAGGAWQRARLDVSTGDKLSTESVLIVLSGAVGDKGAGSIILQAAGAEIDGSATVVRCWV